MAEFHITKTDVELLIQALCLAIDDLTYKVTELGETGDYEPEDIEAMSAKVERFDELGRKLANAL